ncbi:hypothetical protein MNV49_006988 [Pseudohyphozyma bogoriensis]|nr:hypothetical protein MNV49_006988 [Pseudohyphozyma bogoriensis]
MADNLDLALLGGAALMFLIMAPLMSSWIANGRFAGAWLLSGGKGKKGGVGVEDRLTRFQTRQGMKVPARVRVVSNWFAHARYLYNKVLLPTVPLVNLTVGQVLVGLLYIGVVLFFLFFDAGNLQSNYKRPAFIGVAQMPAVFLLATKNNILLSALGKGYEKLNFLHRLAGRMMILCTFLHVFFFFKMQGTLNIDYSSPTIYTGVATFSAVILIFFTSLPFFRAAFYQIFLYSHIIGWLTFLIALNFHVPEVVRPYTYFVIAVLGSDFLLRAIKTRVRSATVVPLSAGMTMVQCHGVSEGWRPGQHVWVRVFYGGAKGGEAHPFTVANAPKSYPVRSLSTPDLLLKSLPFSYSPPSLVSNSGQHNLTLLAKSTGNWTRGLLAASQPDQFNTKEEKQSFGFGKIMKVSIEGPYGGTYIPAFTHAETQAETKFGKTVGTGPMYTDFSESQSVLLVAGGSGITFAASVLEEVIGLAVQGRGRTKAVTLVWSMKAIECVDWYQEMMTSLVALAKNGSSDLVVKIRLFVTGPVRANYIPIPGSTVLHSRPDIPLILLDVVEDALRTVETRGYERAGGVAVGTCGPMPLVKEVRRAVSGVEKGMAVKAGGIVVHSETFGW